MKVWLVVMHQGEYSDYTCSLVGIYSSRFAAEVSCQKLSDELGHGNSGEFILEWKEEVHSSFHTGDDEMSITAYCYADNYRWGRAYYDMREYEVQDVPDP
jgi:hypothetical protein